MSKLIKRNIRPLFGGLRTLLILARIKIFHSASGWKYFFASFGSIKINSGSLAINSGFWLEAHSLIHCDNGSIIIGKRVFINRNSSLISKKSIRIGNDVLIADNVTIIDHDHKTSRLKIPFSQQGFNVGSIDIRDNCWIGSHVTILKGVSIGPNSIVAAGAVVTKPIPEWELWGGVPAKFIKKIT